MSVAGSNADVAPDHDGGSAFPMDYYGHVGNGDTTGTTLRDYFAAHAPAPPAEIVAGDVDAEARWRWKYADAMIEARQSTRGSDGQGTPAQTQGAQGVALR